MSDSGRQHALENIGDMSAWQFALRRVFESRNLLQSAGVTLSAISAGLFYMDARRRGAGSRVGSVAEFHAASTSGKRALLVVRGGLLGSARPVSWAAGTLALSGLVEAGLGVGVSRSSAWRKGGGNEKENGKEGVHARQEALLQTLATHSVAGGVVGALLGAGTVEPARGMGYYMLGRSVIAHATSTIAKAAPYAAVGMAAGAALPVALAFAKQ